MNVNHVGVLLAAVFTLASCSAPSPPALSVLRLDLINQNGEYTPGEQIGLTVHFDPEDQLSLGLPQSDSFEAATSGRAATRTVMDFWAGKLLEDQPDQWECFRPMEIRDDSDRLLLTITDFCPAGSPELELFGDPAGTDGFRYEFQKTIDGQSVEVVVER